MKPFKTFNNRIKNSTCLFINLIVSSILLCVIIEIDLKSRDLITFPYSYNNNETI